MTSYVSFRIIYQIKDAATYDKTLYSYTPSEPHIHHMMIKGGNKPQIYYNPIARDTNSIYTIYNQYVSVSVTLQTGAFLASPPNMSEVLENAVLYTFAERSLSASYMTYELTHVYGM